MVTQAVKESEVTSAWQRVIRDGVRMTTVDNTPVQILYPGRPSDEPGADIRDAVLNIDGNVKKGNIEIHVRSSDWRRHCHHLDQAYNGVVLHVVKFHDSGNFTRLENGNDIPIIAINNVITRMRHGRKESICWCRGRKSDADGEMVLNALDHAGKERFIEKQNEFLVQLKRDDAGQCLYSGIMGALGYSKNVAPLKTLAEMITLRELERLARDAPESTALENIEQRLLETAGFLPATVHKTDLLSWRLFRVRPGNHPARRLAGMARLIIRYKQTGLLSGLVQFLIDCQEKEWKRIEAGLVVEADEYWSDHYCPGKQCHLADRFLVGGARARETIINVLLPFAVSYGKNTGQSGLAEKAMTLYDNYPATRGNNIERHMSLQMGVKLSQIKTASQQQGLLHLYKRFCTQGRCGECPLLNSR